MNSEYKIYQTLHSKYRGYFIFFGARKIPWLVLLEETLESDFKRACYKKGLIFKDPHFLCAPTSILTRE